MALKSTKTTSTACSMVEEGIVIFVPLAYQHHLPLLLAFPPANDLPDLPDLSDLPSAWPDWPVWPPICLTCLTCLTSHLPDLLQAVFKSYLLGLYGRRRNYDFCRQFEEDKLIFSKNLKNYENVCVYYG
jgi:hypothetical protein